LPEVFKYPEETLRFFRKALLGVRHKVLKTNLSIGYLKLAEILY
jgi:hypothetical protein